MIEKKAKVFFSPQTCFCILDLLQIDFKYPCIHPFSHVHEHMELDTYLAIPLQQRVEKTLWFSATVINAAAHALGTRPSWLTTMTLKMPASAVVGIRWFSDSYLPFCRLTWNAYEASSSTRLDMYTCWKHAYQCGKSSHLLLKMKLISLDQGSRPQTTSIPYPCIPGPAAPSGNTSWMSGVHTWVGFISASSCSVLCWLFLHVHGLLSSRVR